MFGYINAYKDLLRVCDYNVYRGYYCGLCKALGKRHNIFTRFGISYDMAFLAILLSSLEDTKTILKYENCIAHPLSKRPVVYEDKAIEYCADISVILTYMKLKDDWDDEKSFKSFGRIAYIFSMKRVSEKYPLQYRCIKENLLKLSFLERTECDNLDMIADTFGKLLEGVFDTEGNNKILGWLGYHIGRFIYITDAYKDIEKDIKNESYNPFIKKYGKNIDKNNIKQNIKESLEFTLSEISNAYNLLNIKKNNELLENIIYLGIRKNLDNI